MRLPRPSPMPVSLLVLAALAAGSAHATKQDEIHETSEPNAPGSCPVGDYESGKAVVGQPIPDGDPAGLVTPAIRFEPQPGVVISDVVVDLCVDHTWVGDLVVILEHTSSGGRVKTVRLIDRPGVPQSTFGCSGDLRCDPENKITFGTDSALEALAETGCPSTVPGGCYAVAPENENGLEIFEDQPKGDGVWELRVSDRAAGDTGFVHDWSVHLLCAPGPLPVEESSWGSIKGGYRSERAR